jgi:hypothetical protein
MVQKRERGIRHFDGKMLKKHHIEYIGRYGRIILKKDLKEVV